MDDTGLTRSSDGGHGSRAAYPRGVSEPDATTASPGRRPPRPAAFFDLDKTIIAKSSTLAYAKPFYRGGLINRRAVLRSGYAQFVYTAGGADHDQIERMRAYLSAM